jgi:hypothetical protein
MAVIFINRLVIDTATGRAVVSDSVPAAGDPYVGGFRFANDASVLYIQTGSIPAGAVFSDGFAFNPSNGRICALIDNPPSAPNRIYNDGVLGDASGHMCFTTTNSIVSYMHGWPLDAIGQVCITGGSPPPEDVSSFASGLLLLDTIGLYTHTSGSGLGTLLAPLNFTEFTPAYTARITAVSPAASDDSGALGPASSINHGQFCTDTDSGSFCTTDSRTNVNNAFGIFSSLTPSPDDPSLDPSFSYSDQNCSGDFIGSVGSPTVPTAVMQVGAASNIRQSSSDPAETGTSTAINTWTITDLAVVSSMAPDINFNASAYLEAYLDAAGLSGATATMTVEITLKAPGNVTVFHWLPDGTTGALSPGGTSLLCPFSLNDNVGVTAPSTGADFAGSSLGVRNGPGRFKASMPTIIADVFYSLTVVTSVTISATNSP